MNKAVRTTARASRPPRGRRPSPSIRTEDYLERIAELIETKGYARAVDLAEALAISRPSVTAMVQRLAREGYVVYEKYRRLQLTAAGARLAAQIKSRHATLKRFLSVIGVDERTQEDDIEGWEHCLSAATLERLGHLVKALAAHPGLLELSPGDGEPAAGHAGADTFTKRVVTRPSAASHTK